MDRFKGSSPGLTSLSVLLLSQPLCWRKSGGRNDPASLSHCSSLPCRATGALIFTSRLQAVVVSQEPHRIVSTLQQFSLGSISNLRRTSLFFLSWRTNSVAGIAEGRSAGLYIWWYCSPLLSDIAVIVVAQIQGFVWVFESTNTTEFLVCASQNAGTIQHYQCLV